MIEMLMDPQVLEQLANLEPLQAFPFLPLIFAGVSAALGGVSRRKQQDQQNVADLQDRFAFDQLSEKQFDPMGPFERARKGRIYGALARTWGLDKILGEQYINHIENYANYPGTSAIGGGRDLTTPQAAGLTLGDRSAGRKMSFLSSILGGVGTAFSGGGFGGGGGDDDQFKGLGPESVGG